MKILVTGATGFVGRGAARILVSRRAVLRCLVRPGSDRSVLAGLGSELVEGDLADEESLRRALDGCTTVLHLAAEDKAVSWKELSAVNVEGSRRLARLSAEAHVERFVYLSVLARPRPWARVGLSRLLAEKAVREALPAIILRSAPAFGPGDGLACTLLARLRRGWAVAAIPGQGTWKTQPIWVDDLAECLAAVTLGGRAEPGPREVAGPEVMTVLDFHDALCAALGIGRLRVHVPETVLRFGGFQLLQALGREEFPRLAEFFISSTEAEKNLAGVLLGRPLVTVKEGLARMLGQPAGTNAGNA